MQRDTTLNIRNLSFQFSLSVSYSYCLLLGPYPLDTENRASCAHCHGLNLDNQMAASFADKFQVTTTSTIDRPKSWSPSTFTYPKRI